jgi:hypothetical protein
MGMSDQAKKSQALVADYCSKIAEAFLELKKVVPHDQIEKLASDLVHAMGSDSRDYHKPEHSLDVAKGQTAIGILAAVFHDIIYVQVDPSWKETFSDQLAQFTPVQEHKLNIEHSYLREKNLTRKAIVLLFGFENVTEITPSKGLNELLSALAMESKLSPYLSAKEILRVASCIEATIPFRKIDAGGKTSADRLKARLNKAGALIDVIFTISEKEEIVEDCRSVVERDLSSFASDDFNDFVLGTWNVMYENNPVLRNPFFTVVEYRKAVYGVVPFLSSLSPEQMFWHNSGSRDEKNKLISALTNRNLTWGITYLKLVGLSLSVLEAIALETGGDLPYVSLVSNYTNQTPFTEKSEIASLLQKHFPLACDLYQNLSQTEIDELYLDTIKMQTGLITPEIFLSLLPSAMLKSILVSLSTTCDGRSRALAKKIA